MTGRRPETGDGRCWRAGSDATIAARRAMLIMTCVRTRIERGIQRELLDTVSHAATGVRNDRTGHDFNLVRWFLAGV